MSEERGVVRGGGRTAQAEASPPVAGALTGLPDPIHCVGVSGGGMSVLAALLASLGHRVSGSDRSRPRRAPPGVTVHAGHAAAHLGEAALLVRSAAVPDDNAEVAAARAAGVPVLKYSEAVGRLMAARPGLAVAGTHGKTTTTALLGHLLLSAGADPCWLIGGTPKGAPAGRWGAGPFVVEACEYDHSFLHLHYGAAAVLSTAVDHLDCFGDAAAVQAAYRRFAAALPPGGLLVLGPGVAPGGWPAHVRAARADDLAPLVDVAEDEHGLHGAVAGGSGGAVPFRLRLLGRHNLANLQVALALAAHATGRPPAALAPFVESFAGVQRRLDDLGERPLAPDGGEVRVIDDFAHHPDALVAAAEAVAGRFPGRRVVAVFQPHQVSRTEDLLDDFARALLRFDALLLCDIFAARDRHPERAGAVAAALAARVPSAVCVGPAAGAAPAVRAALRDGDVCLVMGAGDVDALAAELGRTDRP